MRLPQLQGKRIVSIYFGGGTPTKLAPKSYSLLLEAIRSAGVEIADSCEITLEGNPEDVTLPLMREFHALGINRLSLGVQSLVDDDLIVLGRTHTASRSKEAILAAFNAGIGNISIDLMFELPFHTLERWKRSLQALSTLPISHLSLYNLTFEPHTVFFKQREQLQPSVPSEQENLQALELALEAFSSLGLTRYEISAFAKPGKHSLHNSGYWTGRPFLGFGPSAFSYWEGSRFSNVAHFQHYVDFLEKDQLPVAFNETLEFPRNLQELFAVRLRLVEGVDLAAFCADYGPLPGGMGDAIVRLKEKGWLIEVGDWVRLTPLGQLFYDSVAVEMI